MVVPAYKASVVGRTCVAPQVVHNPTELLVERTLVRPILEYTLVGSELAKALLAVVGTLMERRSVPLFVVQVAM